MQTRTLSEFESKRLLGAYGVPTVAEAIAADEDAAAGVAAELGFPVALKLCAAGLAHKTERNLVRLGLADEAEVRAAAADLLGLRGPGESEAALLVQRMARGRRELIAGLVRDGQFGRCVMLGIGGIFAEVLGDVVFRLVPLTRCDALEMMDDLRASRVLAAFRGDPAVDRGALAEILLGLARLSEERRDVVSVDVNPLIVTGSSLVAVDALVEVEA
jgi:acyl-CoA synthetase (NDP forming)